MKVACVYIGEKCPRAERLAHASDEWHFMKVPVAASKPFFSRAINFVLLLLGMHGVYAARQSFDADLSEFDAVVCHDLILLPWLLTHGTNAQSQQLLIMADLREYYPRHFEHSLWWRLIWGRYYDYLVRIELPRAQACVTVSAGLAKLYATDYGVDAVVIHSYAEASGLSWQPTAEPIRLVHMGNASRHRCLENMIEAVAMAKADLQLDLFLVSTDDRYHRELRQLADALPNVRICKPVPFAEIHRTLNEYDVGLFTSPASTINLEFSLPNKIFDYVQANLAIVVSPLPDCAEFVEQWGVGVVAEAATAQAIAKVLENLDTANVDATKARAHAVAQQLNAQKFRDAFKTQLTRLVQ